MLIRQFVQPGAVHALALSPDGKWLATAGADDDARVFALHGDPTPIMLTHSAVVNHLAFSPDGRSLVTRACKRRRSDLDSRRTGNRE